MSSSAGVDGLPEKVRRMAARAQEERLPLLYFGLGSMLSIMFMVRADFTMSAAEGTETVLRVCDRQYP